MIFEQSSDSEYSRFRIEHVINDFCYCDTFGAHYASFAEILLYILPLINAILLLSKIISICNDYNAKYSHCEQTK